MRGLSTGVRPTADLHLLDSERMTGNRKLAFNRKWSWDPIDMEIFKELEEKAALV